MGEWAWLGSVVLLSFLLSSSEVKHLPLVASSEQTHVQREVLECLEPMYQLALHGGGEWSLFKDWECTISCVLWALAWQICGSLGLWRSVEDAMVVEVLRRRQNDASGLVLGFGVVVAQDLVKSVSGVNGCGAFVKFD